MSAINWVDEPSGDYIHEKQKQYREQNRDEISERNKRLFTCECGRTLRWKEKARHFGSKTHKLLIEAEQKQNKNTL